MQLVINTKSSTNCRSADSSFERSPIISPAEKDGDRRPRRLYRLGCGNDLYLDSRASYEVAQLVAGTVPLALNEQTLRHRLCAHGLLASVDLACQTLLVRRTLTGCPRHVLHLNASRVVGAIAEPG